MIFYHLATPRAGSTVWAWESGAFGKETPTGSATVNLRFPGQYFDSETGLHYNWNRYYNPATGRYVSSDPIGLAGGLNTFGYAGQSPVVSDDPEGQNVEAIPACIMLGGALLTLYGLECSFNPKLFICPARDDANQQGNFPQSMPNTSNDSGGSSKPPVSTPGAQAGSPMPDPDDEESKNNSSNFDPVRDLKGKSFEDAEAILDKELKGWTKGPIKKGDGVRYYDGKGNSIQLNRGYPDDPWADTMHEGPYAKISRNGQKTRIMLAR